MVPWKVAGLTATETWGEADSSASHQLCDSGGAGSVLKALVGLFVSWECSQPWANVCKPLEQGHERPPASVSRSPPSPGGTCGQLSASPRLQSAPEESHLPWGSQVPHSDPGFQSCNNCVFFPQKRTFDAHSRARVHVHNHTRMLLHVKCM